MGQIHRALKPAAPRDWREGAVVYQVFVDRFAPPKDPAATAKKFLPPKRFRPWSELPTSGYLEQSLGVWSHELDFWGGDLQGIRERLPYVRQLGADVLYMTPIHRALTNHRYDAIDYMQIAPELGTKADLRELIGDAHRDGMKVVLDGVFNHMGASSPYFLRAFNEPTGPYRKWFYIGSGYPNGYRAWAGARNLAALNLRTNAVREYIWGGRNSVVRSYLRDGADGWRLDVGYELGPEILSEITKAAHQTKPGSEVVGEILGYPAGWFPEVDGVFNFYSLKVAQLMLDGSMSGSRAGKLMERAVQDAGLENALRSWLLIDNHDTARAANQIPDWSSRRLVEALLFTLPGSPVIYYGTELGMKGSGDPENRAPMRWDLASSGNREYQWFRKLIRIRRAHPALRYGDFRLLDTDRLLAFARSTDKVRESAIVVVNPLDREVKESFGIRLGRIMSWGDLADQVTGTVMPSRNGILQVTAPPKSVMIFCPKVGKRFGYSPYDRIP